MRVKAAAGSGRGRHKEVIPLRSHELSPASTAAETLNQFPLSRNCSLFLILESDTINLNLLHNSSLHTHKFPTAVNLDSIRIPQNLLHNLRKLFIRHASTSHWNRRQLRTNPNLQSLDRARIDALAFALGMDQQLHPSSKELYETYINNPPTQSLHQKRLHLLRA
jgi:hypothetical protein